MSKHAVPRQHRFARLWLPGLILIAGVAGLLLTIQHRACLRRTAEPLPSMAQPAPQHPAGLPVRTVISPESLSHQAAEPPELPQALVEPGMDRTASRQVAPKRIVERLSTDTGGRPLSFPDPMAQLDTLRSLRPLPSR